MKLAWVSLSAVVVFVAYPAATFAQYQEAWSAQGFSFVSPGFTTPGSMADIDGDGAQELVGEVNIGGTMRVQIRDALTGAIEFTSTTGFPNDFIAHWTTYILNLDANFND